MGKAHAILDVLNKHFQDVMHISRTQSSLVQVLFYLGYFVMAIPAGLLIDRRGYRTGVVVGLLLYGIGALLFWPGAQIMSFGFFLFSLFIIACGLVFLETAANPYVTELGDHDTAPSRLNLAQSFNGLGCIFGPLLRHAPFFGQWPGPHCLAIRGDGHSSPAGGHRVPAACACPKYRTANLPVLANAIPHTRRSSLSALFHNRYFLFGLFALFSYEIAEISINSFFINYVTDEGWMSARDASVALSFGGLGLFTSGRVSGSFVMQHIAGETVLRVCAVGTFVTTFLVVLDLGMVSLCALVLIYVFESIMFPTIFALSLQGLGPLTKRASSLLMMTPIGGAIGPFLMGSVPTLPVCR